MIREKLAVEGARPAFPETLHVGRPNVGSRERLLERLASVLDSRWLSNNGPVVQEFEAKVAECVGVRHCIAVCNATVGLEITIRALGLSGEVIVPAYTFVATAHALQWQGITPVFADIDPTTHNLDPKSVEALITHRTTGIIGVHVWGRPCAVDELEEIADRFGLALIFDAAHAFGCSHRGHMLGRFGNAEVFSFHATKFLNSFEGGAVATNDDDLANRIRLMKNFGFAGFDRVVSIGTNGKMTEVCAAAGLTNLECLAEFVEKNRGNYELYCAELQDIPGLSAMKFPERERNNYQYVVVEIDPVSCPLTRDELMRVLHAENVLARRYFWPGVHRMEPYRTSRATGDGALYFTEMIAERVLLLPTGTAVDDASIRTIAEVMRYAVKHSTAVRRQLQA